MWVSLYLYPMRAIVWLVLMMILFSCQQNRGKEENQKVWNSIDSATTFIQLRKEGDNWIQLKKNSRFEVINVLSEKGIKPTLFRIESEEHIHPDSTYPLNHYRVTARLPEANEPQWTNELEGQEFDINSREIRITQITNGTDEDYISLYSLETGKKICGFCYGGLEVMIPNSSARRYFGYTSLECAGRSLEKPQQGSLLGKIVYAANTGAAEEWEIHLNRTPLAAVIPHRTPELKWIHTEGKNAAVQDGQSLILTAIGKSFTAEDITDFSIRMTYFYGDGESTAIEIPIYNDHLDISRATFDRSLFRLTQ